ncbi:PPE family protein [Mycobacterium colombiense]
MLDFAQLPPEINSALMYSGPGSAPLRAAATAWDGLATELDSAASAYGSVIAGLTDGPWQGPAASAMLTAAVPQVAWLRGTGGQLEQAALQAVAAAAAYEVAFAETVPPPVIAANRALLMELLATNFLGQNTPAIAATEAQYDEMWAQDAAAMYGYAGASAAASTLPPFEPAEPVADPAGTARQAAAVAQAAGASGSESARALDAVPQTLSAVAGSKSSTAGADALAEIAPNSGTVELPGWAGTVLETLTGSSTLHPGTPIDFFKEWVSPTRLFVTIFKDIEGLGQSLMPKAAAKAVEGVAKAAGSALPSALSSAGLGSAAGALGKAVSIGGLSVPQVWASAAPALPPAVTTVGGVQSVAAAGPAAHAVGGVPVMNSGVGRSAGAHFVTPRYGFKPTVIAQPPAGG